MPHPIRRISLVTFFVLVGFAAGLVLTGRMRTAEEAGAQPESAGQSRTPAPQPAVRTATSAIAGLPDLTQAAQIAIPGVPNISSQQVVRTPNSPFMNDPFFREFFGGQSPFGYRERLQQSLGSGVVVSSDGYVLTNNHVVGDARAEVSVTLPDKRELPARIIGVDEATDLALLKIDARNLPVLAWGDSSKLRVAEWVLAIGNPFGVLNQTVTLGIVSATGRNLQGSLDMYVDFIQTDAAINQGNSGGALVNGRGELVGINTAIFSQSGGSQGVGFAVPSNVAKHVMEEIIEHGAVRRGTITDIELYPMNTRLADELKAPNAKGVIVSNISPNSDAYAAGVRRYDIIVSFNNTPVEDASHFMRMLAESPIGGTVTLGLLRNGRTLSSKVPVVQSGARLRRR
jgi:Do/DeqQ family serine protease